MLMEYFDSLLGATPLLFNTRLESGVRHHTMTKGEAIGYAFGRA
jgi:hypothetical protein